ncbi:MAG: DUF1361 domain-containing protein [Bacteroidota bacterium]
MFVTKEKSFFASASQNLGRGSLPVFLFYGLISAASVGLLLYRVWMSGSATFLFLGWNLFLAWIPFLISNWLVSKPERKSWMIVLALGAWLPFFPNAPYILTDLFHLRARPGVPLWLDLILLISFAWTGLLLGLNSLRQIQVWLFDRWGAGWSWISVSVVLLLSSFGVYLGRYLRWNSWDILQRPGELIADIFDIILHPFVHDKATGFTLAFCFFLLMAYGSIVFKLNQNR